MLCNNEQFSSATVILNVFIVNMIWSKVSGRHGSESTCAFKQCWLNGNTSEYLMMYSSSNSINVFVSLHMSWHHIHRYLGCHLMRTQRSTFLSCALTHLLVHFIFILHFWLTWNFYVYDFIFRYCWNKCQLCLDQCMGKIGAKSTSNNHFYALNSTIQQPTQF